MPGVGVEGDLACEDVQSAAGDGGVGGVEAVGEGVGVAFAGVNAPQNRDEALPAGFVAPVGQRLVGPSSPGNVTTGSEGTWASPRVSASTYPRSAASSRPLYGPTRSGELTRVCQGGRDLTFSRT